MLRVCRFYLAIPEWAAIGDLVAVFEGRGWVQRSDGPTEIAPLRPSMPSVPERSEKCERKARRAIPTDLAKRWVEEFPWMKEVLNRGSISEAKRRKLTGAGASTPSHVDVEMKSAPLTTYTDAEISDIYARLMDVREEMSVDIPGITHFYVRVNGGFWTHKHKKKDADTVQGQGRGNQVKQWAKRFKWTLQPVFTFSTYGRWEANHLALEWARRSQHLWNMYANAEDPQAFLYPPDPFADYVEDACFIEFMCQDDLADATFARGVEVRNMRPTNPAIAA